MSKLQLSLILYLIGWLGDAILLDQSESKAMESCVTFHTQLKIGKLKATSTGKHLSKVWL